jgi:hypothetical protein
MHVFTCGSPHGVKPCAELASHVKGQLHTEIYPQKQGGPIAVWGQIRGAKELLEKHGDFYRLDHAYFGRNEAFRMTKGDFQPSAIKERPGDRWETLKKRLNLEIQPWKTGKKIVVALSMPGTYDFFGVSGWGKQVISDLQRFGRPIIERQRKETRPLKEDLKNAHCLVTYASNSVLEALLAGVPVFVAGPSIARPMAGEWLDIETPVYPENREEFFRHVAYCQYTLEEFKSGFALKCAEENWATVTRS